MANAPHTWATTPAIELHVRHMPGGKFTDHVFSAMKDKEILRIEGPFGSFFLREDSDKPIILLASGTGFAPIKAIIEHMQFKGIDRPAVLYWGCRRRPTSTCTTGPSRPPPRCRTLRYVPVLSEPRPEDALDTAAPASSTGGDGTTCPTCRATRSTPAARRSMVESAERDFIARCGLPADEFYADAFTSEADKHGPPVDRRAGHETIATIEGALP